MPLQTPVALIFFNRPDTIARVFTEIAKVRPTHLLLVADGPRAGHPEDQERCAAARAAVERVDWDCDVRCNYSDINLGCGMRPATGIDWVFEQVDRAIIVEDDCLPHPSFFRFCEELLDRYEDDERIMQVCGNNFQRGHRRTPYSYFFSIHNICWGWASWRRAWKHFDMGVQLWPKLRDTNWLIGLVGESRAARFWAQQFEMAYQAQGQIHHWDFQWTFACWVQSGLSILPEQTLISNIGCRDDATHTRCHTLANLPIEEMAFPLAHPPYVVRQWDADRFFLEQAVLHKIPSPTWRQRLRRRAVNYVPPTIRSALSGLCQGMPSKERTADGLNCL